ncbi:MAG: hypothetical protein U1B30_10105 [Pseudomonadota bacterium]|nr:hypothetical protein [Pseudomonadota bacterium]
MVWRMLLALMLTGVMSGCQAGLAGVLPGEAGAALTQTMRYFDGQRWREVWVNEREVVEFFPPGQAVAARAVAPAATLLVEGVGVRIWRLGQQAGEAVAVSRALAPAKQLSPVFHLSSVGGSRLALTGNIVVRFKPEWSDKQIQAWIAAQNLTQIKMLNGVSAIYVISVGSGLDALARANAIQESGAVVYAMPEWWREISKR